MAKSYSNYFGNACGLKCLVPEQNTSLSSFVAWTLNTDIVIPLASDFMSVSH